MKTPSKKTNKIDLDFYLKSLFLEASEALGEEFNRLPKRIQTGYIKIFWNYSGIIRHNQHIKKPDSFTMCEEEVQRHFTSRKDFRAVNNTGYWLRPNLRLKDGGFVLERKKGKNTIEYDATKWVTKTIMSSQGAKSGAGYCNGYQLSPKIRDLVATWHAKSDDELSDERGFVNHKGESILEIATKLGGAISRDKSVTSSEVNVSVLIQINKRSLIHHKRQVKIIERELEVRRVDTLTCNSKEWKEVASKVVTNEEGKEERERKEETPRLALGGVNRDISLQSILSKDFTLEGTQL